MWDLNSYVWVGGGVESVEADHKDQTYTHPCESENNLDQETGEKRAVHSQTIGNPSRKQLPPEIWQSIVGYAMYSSSEVIDTGDRPSLRKEKLGAIIGLANAAKSLRIIVLGCWARELTYQFPEDKKIFEGLGNFIDFDASIATRRLHCLDTFKIYQAPADALEMLNLLEELVISGHSDIDFGWPMSGSDFATAASDVDQHQALADHDARPEGISQRMSYRKLKVRFPRTLRVLKIYDSHVPDIYFIHKVADECPNLHSLTLARCTMFTRSDCEFWTRLPSSESDSYFSNHGVETYATAVGKELSKIPKLEEVGIGIYLTNHEAIGVHLREHMEPASGVHTNGVWKEPCHKCALEYQEQTEASETKASLILAGSVPKLSWVSWQSFFTRGRTGWHRCPVNVK